MPDQDKIDAARNAYITARDALRNVMLNYEEGEELDEATDAFRVVRRAYKKALDEDFADRTRLLKKLIAQLNGVIEDVELNPIGDALGKLNGALEVATAALEAESGQPG